MVFMFLICIHGYIWICLLFEKAFTQLIVCVDSCVELCSKVLVCVCGCVYVCVSLWMPPYVLMCLLEKLEVKRSSSAAANPLTD